MENNDDVRKAAFSLGLCYLLDCVGYSPEMDKFRRMHCRYEDQTIYLYKQDLCQCHRKYRISVGSKAEGGSRVYESDWDTLYVCQNVVCAEACVLLYRENLSKEDSVYTMVPCLYHPGHFKLLLTKEGLQSGVAENLRSCLNSTDSGHWLSSKEFLRRFKDSFKVTGEREGTRSTAGPSVSTLSSKLHAHDNVVTLPCICPSILQKWIQRQRKYNWPPNEVIQQISQMRGNLVATGIKECPQEKLEWRLCFNEIGLLLVKNFNDTATKLYIFLKMIKKDILKLEHEITSYMMKNIVFWLVEENPQTEFRPDRLFSWVTKALRLLKRAVKRFYLPYYMIPERNLIAEKLPKHRIKDVIKQINNIINLGPQSLWRCTKIEMAMTMSLPELQLYKQKNDELEQFGILRSQDSQLKTQCLGLTKSVWENTDYIIAIGTRMNELVYSPWPHVLQKQLDKCSNDLDMQRLLLK